jgi:hypothetical protein
MIRRIRECVECGTLIQPLTAPDVNLAFGIRRLAVLDTAAADCGVSQLLRRMIGRLTSSYIFRTGEKAARVNRGAYPRPERVRSIVTSRHPLTFTLLKIRFGMLS